MNFLSVNMKFKNWRHSENIWDFEVIYNKEDGAKYRLFYCYQFNGPSRFCPFYLLECTLFHTQSIIFSSSSLPYEPYSLLSSDQWICQTLSFFEQLQHLAYEQIRQLVASCYNSFICVFSSWREYAVNSAFQFENNQGDQWSFSFSCCWTTL